MSRNQLQKNQLLQNRTELNNQLENKNCKDFVENHPYNGMGKEQIHY